MKASVTVRYVSGREEQFEVELWGGSSAQARLDEFLKAPNLVLKTANELIIIPGSAVECLSIALPKGDPGRPQLQGVRPAKRLK
jgi:small nuclear ribonucleoprotein (snRNP)-like protein